MPQIKTENKGGSGWLTYLGIAFLIGGGAFFYFRVLTGKGLTPVEGAEVVPESAMMTAFISTEPKSWQKLQQFGSNEAQELIGKTIADWEQEAYADSRIDYQKDIQPWIGNAMVAFLPSESGSWDRDGENLLLVLGIKNKLKAWNFAEKLKKEEGKEITKTKYKGVTIYLETSTDSDEQGATAILDNYNKVVFSENIETIKLAIDTYKGEKTSFVANPEAKKALSQKLGLKNPIFAFHLADYGKLIGQALASASNQELSTETLEQLMVLESAVMGLGFEDKGLRLKYLVNLNQSALNECAAVPTLSVAGMFVRIARRKWGSIPHFLQLSFRLVLRINILA